MLGRHFQVERFANSLNVSAAGSKLRVQIQTDPRYFGFPDRATVRDVLGLALPVASIEDILQGKIWAATDAKRRPSQRRKDLPDIERLIESYRELRTRIPDEIRERLSKIELPLRLMLIYVCPAGLAGRGPAPPQWKGRVRSGYPKNYKLATGTAISSSSLRADS